MNYFHELKQELRKIIDALAADGRLSADLDLTRAGFEPPREAAHGDVATNAALVLAKQANMKPRDLAALLAEELGQLNAVAGVDVAGPGFINLRLAPSFWHSQLAAILGAGTHYGSCALGQGEKVNVEYVSANPTGPLHVGHCRGAVFGDALAALLERAGYDVTREYYINDAGAQVDALARSAHLRYREALGEDIGEIPEGLYPGEYLKDVGAALAARDGDRWLGVEEPEWLAPVRAFAIDALMDLIRDDLAALDIEMDVFTSERGLVEAGRVDDVLADLKQAGHMYRGVLEPPKGMKVDDWEPREQTLFRSTAFGDDVDRPVMKSDGSWTYFATDIANHYDKFQRGFCNQIDVWGADHGGYVKRMKAAVAAASGGKAELDVKLCQMVNLMDKGQPVRMSKRAGSFVTLRDVVDQVGKDVVRFIMLTRKNDAMLDFDLTKVTEQSRENPVWYVQYAHARTRSVLRQAKEQMAALDTDDAALAAAALDRLSHSAELDLIRKLAEWPALIEGAASAHEPHRLAFYLHELAAEFHALWTKGKEEPELRFIIESDAALTGARLALVRAVGFVIAAGLGIFGVAPLEEL
ncbi:MAG: arginine--tRNA ligase [Alphaproteobacteria bacterium]|nr:arginine--tRNA ligase [Alphaproteobacteria bacterium]